MADDDAAAGPRRDACLVLGLAVLALVATPARVSALTPNDFPNSGYCSNGNRTTDLSTCGSKGKKRRAAPSARGKQRVR